MQNEEVVLLDSDDEGKAPGRGRSSYNYYSAAVQAFKNTAEPDLMSSISIYRYDIPILHLVFKFSSHAV
jgi:hypothetical protein